MLIRLSLAAATLLLISQPAAAKEMQGFIPTSDAIRMAEIVARAQGYDLSDRRRYFFDLLRAADGRPLIAGYTTFEFQWDGNLVATIAIDDHRGLAVDTASCSLFDYPALRAYRSGPAVAPAALKEQTGCDAFRRVSVPKPSIRQHKG